MKPVCCDNSIYDLKGYCCPDDAECVIANCNDSSKAKYVVRYYLTEDNNCGCC